jgi:O-antigen/teichoic acid export membrane protein
VIRYRLLVGTLSNCMGKLASVGIWFLLTPFLLGRLGPQEYALWVLTCAIASYGFLLDFGVGSAIVKYVAEHTARGEQQTAAALVASARWLFVGFAIVAVGTSVLLAHAIPRWLGVPSALQHSAMWLVVLTGMNVAIAVTFTPPLTVLRGLQRYDLSNAITIAGSIIEAAAAIAAVLAGWGVVGMLAAIVPVNALMGMASTVLVKRVASDLPIGWRGANVAALRRLVSFSSSCFAIETASRLQTKTAEFVIAALGTLEAVTPYALARRLSDVAEMVAVQFLKVVMPLASELHASERRRKLRNLYVVSSRIALAISVPVAVVLTVIGGRLLALWVGPGYAQYAPLVGVLAVSRLIASSQWPASEILLGMTKHRMVAATALTSGVLHVVLSALLLPSFGLTGVAIGGLIPNVIASLCIIMPFASRTLDVSVGTAVREIWAPTILPGVAAAAVLWMLQRDTVSPSLPVVLMWVAASLLVFGIGYLSMPACRAERQLIADVCSTGSKQLRRLTADAARTA